MIAVLCLFSLVFMKLCVFDVFVSGMGYRDFYPVL